MTKNQKLILALGVVIMATLYLTGCSTLKYAECIARDGTSRPCNW